jgi:hypothetical protein
MAKKIDGTKYPYSRLKGLKDFMDFAKEPGWKQPKIDKALFKKLDLAKGKENEALSALRFLGLIDAAGVPTAAFDALKEDYQGTMNNLVRTGYADLFSLIPPRLATQSRLLTFFGKPVETAEYQAKLFAWLCEQAGIELPNVEQNFHRARFDKDKTAAAPEVSESQESSRNTQLPLP